MKKLILLSLLLAGCSKDIPKPFASIEAQQETRKQEYIPITKEIIKSHQWAVTASEFNYQQGCGIMVFFIKPYWQLSIHNPTKEFYDKNPIGSVVSGEVLINILQERGMYE